MREKHISFNYGSLNSNSLVKTSSATTQSFYIRYLREQQFDILSLQETHATPSTIPSMDTQFQAQQTFWTYYCGIVSFSTNYILTQIHTDHIFTSDRFLLCKVHHPHNFYETFYILNVYAPADSNGARRSFFGSMVTLLYELNDIITWNNLIISGDFNYDLARDIDSKRGLFKTSTAWTSLLENFFFNSMIHNSMNNIPTFQRTASITSTIDYIYLGGIIKSRLIDNSVHYIQSQWSDHAILHVALDLGPSKLGPGLFRGNPSYASNPQFKAQLQQKLSELLHQTEKDLITMNAQVLWEEVKKVTQKWIKLFGIKHVSWRKSALKQLERKRNRFLRSKPPIATRLLILPKIDKMIDTLQQELVEIAALKSGVVWREKGEKSPKYLKTIHHQRTAQQFIPGLREPTSTNTELHNNTDSSASTIRVDSHSMNNITQNFYNQLYTKDEVEDNHIQDCFAKY